ncbi:hypothetical protein [Caldicellulosiruptor sp. DIB 104C]|uniref:hypothetical protein n=1 Tax=Caldicellulosiruptor sp. DIB 104C TaxID=3019889 RepID=UPI00230579AA|nr:hypothetical protein [Caldicellulosiruptor sp. DIB 104C]
MGDLIKNADMKRPHVVILGAGASRAALPNGDKNGRKLPIMNGFLKTTGLENILDGVNLTFKSDNLEDIYSELHSKHEYKDVCKRLEDAIWDYFSSLELPDYPTIYDYLLLSLRKKDVIASFNWDPLLLQAYRRVYKITSKLPELLFLHGNVAVGVCEQCKKVGFISDRCSGCGRQFKKSRLLYPIKEKNYHLDPFIKSQWDNIQRYLKNAFSFTVFGYSAPKSDVSAIELLKQAWGRPSERNLEQIQIIDIKEDEELREAWDDFIHTHHYEIHKSFFESSLAKFPRRINEAYWAMFMDCIFVDTHEFHQGSSFEELKKQVQNLVQYEND